MGSEWKLSWSTYTSFHGFVTIHAASPDGLKLKGRDYFSSLGLAVWFIRDRGAWPIHPVRNHLHLPNAPVLVPGEPCRRVAVPQFWSQAGIQMLWDVSDCCKNTDSHLMSAFLLTYKLLCSMFLAVSLDPSKHQTARTGRLLPLLMTWIFLVGYYAPFYILEILNNYVLRYSIPTL